MAIGGACLALAVDALGSFVDRVRISRLPRLQKNRSAEHPACKRGRLSGENRHFPLRVYSQKHTKWCFCVNAASPSCPICCRHARPDAIVVPDQMPSSCLTRCHRHARPDRASDASRHIRKKGAPKRSLKPEGRKKTTLSGTDPYRNPRRIPSPPEVRTDFHDLARLISRMRFHPNKDGHSDFCLK